MRLFLPPQPYRPSVFPSIFLAGSIDMDQAERWQDKVIQAFRNKPVDILNPRRNDWDPRWSQNSPELDHQINWELDCLEQASLVIMYFDPAGKSPVTMLELGLFSADPKLIVCCPNGFWRKRNVDIVCQRHSIQTAETLSALINAATQRLGLL